MLDKYSTPPTIVKKFPVSTPEREAKSSLGGPKKETHRRVAHSSIPHSIPEQKDQYMVVTPAVFPAYLAALSCCWPFINKELNQLLIRQLQSAGI